MSSIPAIVVSLGFLQIRASARTDRWNRLFTGPRPRQMAADTPLAYFGGTYGSGVPTLIGGYFFRLASSSPMIFITGSVALLDVSLRRRTSTHGPGPWAGFLGGVCSTPDLNRMLRRGSSDNSYGHRSGSAAARERPPLEPPLHWPSAT